MDSRRNSRSAPRQEPDPEGIASLTNALTRLLQPESEAAKSSLAELARIWSGASTSKERCDVMNAREQHAIDVEQRLHPARQFLQEQLPLRLRKAEVVMGVMPRLSSTYRVPEDSPHRDTDPSI